MSSFLQHYAPDNFEWETPDFCPRTRFLWTKPLTTPPHLATGLKSSNEQLAVTRDGFTSPGSESISDMSISLSDISSARLFATLPAMNRSRSTTNSAGHQSVSQTESLSLSDMSISFSAEVPSWNCPEESETATATAPDLLPCELVSPVLASLSENMAAAPFQCPEQGSLSLGDESHENADAAAVCRLLEWTTSLFTTVANSVLNYSIQLEADDSPLLGGLVYSFDREDVETRLSVTTRDFLTDNWSSPLDPIVKLNSGWPLRPARPITANPYSILMSGSIDYDNINPELVCTIIGFGHGQVFLTLVSPAHNSETRVYVGQTARTYPEGTTIWTKRSCLLFRCA